MIGWRAAVISAEGCLWRIPPISPVIWVAHGIDAGAPQIRYLLVVVNHCKHVDTDKMSSCKVKKEHNVVLSSIPSGGYLIHKNKNPVA